MKTIKNILIIMVLISGIVFFILNMTSTIKATPNPTPTPYISNGSVGSVSYETKNINGYTVVVFKYRDDIEAVVLR